MPGISHKRRGKKRTFLSNWKQKKKDKKGLRWDVALQTLFHNHSVCFCGVFACKAVIFGSLTSGRSLFLLVLVFFFLGPFYQWLNSKERVDDKRKEKTEIHEKKKSRKNFIPERYEVPTGRYSLSERKEDNFLGGERKTLLSKHK